MDVFFNTAKIRIIVGFAKYLCGKFAGISKIFCLQMTHRALEGKHATITPPEKRDNNPIQQKNAQTFYIYVKHFVYLRR
jgi:hypothetical protein